MENMILSGDCICPRFEKTFAILGKKWTGLIIEVLLVDNRRFKDISEQIPEIHHTASKVQPFRHRGQPACPTIRISYRTH